METKQAATIHLVVGFLGAVLLIGAIVNPRWYVHTEDERNERSSSTGELRSSPDVEEVMFGLFKRCESKQEFTKGGAAQNMDRCSRTRCTPYFGSGGGKPSDWFSADGGDCESYTDGDDFYTEHQCMSGSMQICEKTMFGSNPFMPRSERKTLDSDEQCCAGIMSDADCASSECIDDDFSSDSDMTSCANTCKKTHSQVSFVKTVAGLWVAATVAACLSFVLAAAGFVKVAEPLGATLSKAAGAAAVLSFLLCVAGIFVFTGSAGCGCPDAYKIDATYEEREAAYVACGVYTTTPSEDGWGNKRGPTPENQWCFIAPSGTHVEEDGEVNSQGPGTGFYLGLVGLLLELGSAVVCFALRKPGAGGGAVKPTVGVVVEEGC